MNDPNSLPIDRGMAWWSAGFSLFSKSALTWIGITLLMFVIFAAFSLIPVIGGIASQVLAPVFLAGLMSGSRALKEGKELNINFLFTGFSKNTGQLVKLGIIYMLGILVIIFILAVLVMGIPGGREVIGNLQTGDPESMRSSFQFFMIVILIGTALYIPLLMAYWFAPALVMLDDMPPIMALQSSFKACLYNILPFTLYGLFGLVFCVIATIPFGLGYIILTPVVVTSIYAAYEEIYAESSKQAQV